MFDFSFDARYRAAFSLWASFHKKVTIFFKWDDIDHVNPYLIGQRFLGNTDVLTGERFGHFINGERIFL